MSDSCKYCGSGIEPHKKYCNKQCYGNDISKKISSICSYCGDSFEHIPSKDREYCSQECLSNSRSNSITIACDECGEKVKRSAHQIDRVDNIYCSNECNIEAQRNDEKECAYCGITFIPKNSNQKYCSRQCSGKDSRKQITVECANCDNTISRNKRYVEKHNNIFCSNECNSSWRSKNSLFAKNNPNKKDGTYGGFGNNWPKWRDKIRKRADGCCENCGLNKEENGRELSVHHIEPRSKFINDENRVVKDSNNWHNLVALCRSCHMKAEHGKIDVSNNV